jgi:hypothetical protein
MIKLFKFTLTLISSVSIYAQNILPSYFASPLSTGSNMTLMINSPNMCSYIGSQLGVFKYVDVNGKIDCVEKYTIIEGVFDFPILGEYSYTDEHDGLQAKNLK